MGADIINLRQVRKQKARAERAARAAEQRAVSAEPKAVTKARRMRAELEARRLDQSKRIAETDDVVE